jgi:mannitol-1-/sugar-/sorbitol-6-phosphatase
MGRVHSGNGDHGRRDVLGEVFDAVLFDNDSTLTDSKASVERSWVQWALGYGLPLDRLADTHGMPSRQIITRIAPELDLDEATATFGRLELENLGDVSTVPGALEALRSVGHRAAIVTSAGRDLLQRRLEAAGIPSIQVMVTAEDVSHGKPAPDPYLEAARRLGADPSKCLVVEDAVAGIQSARAAGAATLAVLTTTPLDRLHEADLVVNDLSDVRFRTVHGGVRVIRNRCG